jgi:hypothetical protein
MVLATAALGLCAWLSTRRLPQPKKRNEITATLTFFNPFQWMVVLSIWCFVGLFVVALTRVCAVVEVISTTRPFAGTAVLVAFIAAWPLAFISVWVWLGYQDWQSEKQAIHKSRLERLRRREKKAFIKTKLEKVRRTPWKSQN